METVEICAGNSAERWKNQAQLVDARESVHDIKFAPRHLGLRLVFLFLFVFVFAFVLQT